jgi:CRISPR-associated protein Cas5h
MRALGFELSGKTACFRKPDVNAYAYFTYNNIHKPALLGLLGSVVGFGGYTQLFEKNRIFKKGQLGYDEGYPEFYKKLRGLKVAIAPLAPHGYFGKKIQTFNNSVGYASFEQGGNLIVREQWLENPQWQILILDNGSEVFQKISEYLLGGKSVFIPYLGKNDHPAKIDEVKMVELSGFRGGYIDSLFIKNFDRLGFAKEGERPYLFQESSPIRLQKDYHFYEYETLVFTNHEVASSPHDVYSYDGKNYAFI